MAMAAHNDDGTNDTRTRPDVVVPPGTTEVLLPHPSGSAPSAPARRGSRWA